jgi:hypothetical protein
LSVTLEKNTQIRRKSTRERRKREKKEKRKREEKKLKEKNLSKNPRKKSRFLNTCRLPYIHLGYPIIP